MCGCSHPSYGHLAQEGAQGRWSQDGDPSTPAGCSPASSGAGGTQGRLVSWLCQTLIPAGLVEFLQHHPILKDNDPTEE